MSAFTHVLKNSIEYMSILSAVKSGRVPMGVIGLTPVHKAHYISTLANDLNKPCLIICPDEGTATKMCNDLNTFSCDAYVYPARDYSFRPSDTQSREFEQRRLGVLTKMLTHQCRYVLCSVEAAMQLTLPKDELKRRTLTITNGEDISQHNIIRTLLSAGYVRCDQVEGTGQFSIRGGIIDLFPPSYTSPVRLEFWGDTIDSISLFDLDSQRRTDILDEISITPAMEVLFDSTEEMKEKLEAFLLTVKGKGSVKVKASVNEDIDKLSHYINISASDRYLDLAYNELSTVFDYLDDGLLFICESALTAQKYTTSNQLLLEDIRAMFEDGVLTKGIDRYALTWNEITAKYTSMGAIFMDSLARGSFDIPVKELVSVTAGQLPRWDGTLSYLIEDIEPLIKRKYAVVVMAGTQKSAKELAYDLESEGFSSHYFPVVPGEFPKGSVSVLAGTVSSGFEYNSLTFTLFTYGKSTGTTAVKPKEKFKRGKGITSLEEISKGDYIVHAVYGIGIFDGIKTMKVDSATKDFIKINYRGTDVLYLPVTQLDLISKYVTPGQSDKAVKLNRLGSDEWKKTQRKVKSSVRDMAAELTKIYKARMDSPGYAFSPDIDMQNDFERRFEFEETDDQIEAVNEIKGDMEKAVPMDRLLCGDVGFGKTEVALRAAFKCIADGKQCAILVPTTILAFQHYQTIKKRFDGFPVEIEMISRFRTQSQRTKIKKRLKQGGIDIIVGTHSLIAKNVAFKDLGLLIVDEEQRFGVAQKEKLKEKFPLVDVLTLSATPIPRTLNMAMTGIRDMSVLEMPPIGRHPVQTYVLPHNMAVLSEAMDRELRRGGQVYYLHNKVDTIERTAAQIKEYLPDAKIGIGHGKMSEEELSEVWRQLLENEINILVCTTIIETGVDVPNANTLIIEDADRLGLAQLHQIRGRVGRSQRRAFAYFTYNDQKALTDIAQRRLSAIREFTQFGSGFRIAQRDLEIRGAGNILGAQQHGHMEAVGYDMYLQLLGEAIQEETTGVEVKEKKECVVDISVDAHIPEDYIDSVKNRIFMYKRIASIETGEDAMDVIDELIDRFGEPPKSVKGLIDVALLRAYAANLGIYEIKQEKDSIVAYLNDLPPERIVEIAGNMSGLGMVKAAGATPHVVFPLKGRSPIDAIKDMITVMGRTQGA